MVGVLRDCLRISGTVPTLRAVGHISYTQKEEKIEIKDLDSRGNCMRIFVVALYNHWFLGPV